MEFINNLKFWLLIGEVNFNVFLNVINFDDYRIVKRLRTIE